MIIIFTKIWYYVYGDNMKKLFLLIFIVLVFPIGVNSEEKIEVKFYKCVDGDTARFIMNDKEIKVRFLAIDTPETSHPTKGEEPYGKEAKDFTCNKLKTANKIELEFDKNSDAKDKYDRYLAWVFTDDYLLQSELVKNGLAEVAYLYGDYKYTNILKDNEEVAKVQKIGIYSEIDNSYYTSNKDKKINSKKTVKKDKDELYKKIIDAISDLVSSLLEELF